VSNYFFLFTIIVPNCVLLSLEAVVFSIFFRLNGNMLSFVCKIDFYGCFFLRLNAVFAKRYPRKKFNPLLYYCLKPYSDFYCDCFLCVSLFLSVQQAKNNIEILFKVSQNCFFGSHLLIHLDIYAGIGR
jgi:hypothetical protein